MKARAKRQRDAIFLRVVKGGFEPASDFYADLLRARKYRVGDVLRAELTKPRNPRHHRLVFGLLAKVADQLGITTDALLVLVKIRLGMVQPIIDSATGKTYYVPESVDFENMDQGQFATFHRDLCRLIATTWLPHMTADQVAAIDGMMAEA